MTSIQVRFASLLVVLTLAVFAAACDDDDLPQKFWLEGQISEEQMHIEELEKLTSERTAKVSTDRIILREVS